MARSADDTLPFWIKRSGRGGATPEQIAVAERYVGHALPRAFRELLMQQNGGVSNYSAFVDGNRYLPMLPLFGVDSTLGEGSLFSAFDVRRSFGVPDGVVPFAGQGNAWWGLDYRKNSLEPQIIYFDLDEDAPGPEVAANSFDEFLNGLVEDP